MQRKTESKHLSGHPKINKLNGWTDIKVRLSLFCCKDMMPESIALFAMLLFIII